MTTTHTSPPYPAVEERKDAQGKTIQAAKPAGRCVNEPLDTFPFCKPVVCPKCGGSYAEGPAVFVGGLKAGTPTFAAWKLAGEQGRHSDQLALEASAQPKDLLTQADVDAYLAPAVSP